MAESYKQSYTHNCEDIMLDRALGDVERGFYIDVGAYDPVMDSVTKLFYDRGWSGINLEPNDAFFAKLQDGRPRDINLRLAASDTAETLTFHIVKDTGLSTLQDELANQHHDSGHLVEQAQIKAMPLRDIWAAHVPPGQEVHFLKIDVEGAEDNVISGADWDTQRPWILVIEATSPNTTLLTHESWEPTLLAAGYSYVFFDGCNRYYVAQERSHLAKAFQLPPIPTTDVFKPFFAFIVEENGKRTIEQQQRVIEQKQNKLNQLQEHIDTLTEAHDQAVVECDRLNEHIRTLTKAHDQAVTEIDELRNLLSRPLWMRALFRRDGRPKKPVRRLLFHTSGKPRRIFRSLVLTKDKQPRTAFLQWMSGREYQSLRKAVRFSNAAAVPPSPAGLPPEKLSARAEEMISSLKAARATMPKTSKVSRL